MKFQMTFSAVFLLFRAGFICKIICKFKLKYSFTNQFPNSKKRLKHLQNPMVFKDCHLLQIQIITNAELAPTICMFAIFYKIWCYQMLTSVCNPCQALTPQPKVQQFSFYDFPKTYLRLRVAHFLEHPVQCSVNNFACKSCVISHYFLESMQIFVFM